MSVKIHEVFLVKTLPHWMLYPNFVPQQTVCKPYGQAKHATCLFKSKECLCNNFGFYLRKYIGNHLLCNGKNSKIRPMWLSPNMEKSVRSRNQFNKFELRFNWQLVALKL